LSGPRSENKKKNIKLRKVIPVCILQNQLLNSCGKNRNEFYDFGGSKKHARVILYVSKTNLYLWCNKKSWFKNELSCVFTLEKNIKKK